MKFQVVFLVCLFFGQLDSWSAGQLSYGQSTKAQKEERETAKYYEKWLNQDVLHIVTDDERAVFEKLSTFEEKDRFIEQFWFRRDPDPSTAVNEFREEHYRRIAYTNQHFGSGIPGWKTDRGRIYIMFGEPAEIEHHTGGGSYHRQPYEGGGRTSTYPFEVWRYRFVDGIGDDIELEFVDRSWTGEYKLAMNNWEKDLLLQVEGEGLTTAERLGIAKKQLRPGLHPGNQNNVLYQRRMGMRSKDTPFEKMRLYYDLQRPPQIKRKDLQTIVETKVSYVNLPFSLALNYVWIDPESAIVPMTVEVENKSLNYRKLVGNVFKARVGLYGRVISIGGRVVSEFEDSIALEYPEARFELGQKQKSLYQKVLAVAPGMYKLDFVIKDMNSGNIGTVSRSIHIPQYDQSKMISSPVLLAKMLESLTQFPDTPQSFVIGNVKVVPNVTGRFKPADELGVYLQIYNSALDASTTAPALSIDYEIADARGNKLLTQITDKAGNSIAYFSDQRVVLARKIKLSNFEKGRYKITVKVSNVVTGQSTENSAEFEVIGTS